MLKIYNIRLGFATNSSSSHSVIYFPDRGIDDNFHDWEFGWDFFTLASERAKTQYITIILHEALRKLGLKEDVIAREVPNYDEYYNSAINTGYGAYIDHSSLLDLPTDFHNNQKLDKEFWQDFKEFMLKKGIIILGGNDNTNDVHPLYEEYKAVHCCLGQLEYVSGYVARKDPIYDYWSLFNRDTGAKFRFSFPQQVSYKVCLPERAFAPELIDFKITDFCPYGCSFCYQDSTKQGQHADIGYISNILKKLSELKVFEIAYGGGEPTLHPHFIEILEMTREVGIIPNFTTRNLSWMRDEKSRERILNVIGGFAFSVHDVNELRNFHSVCSEYNVPREKMHVHIVMGTVNRTEFRNLLAEAREYNIQVTLLGYKNVGRGTSVDPISYDWWLTELQNSSKQVSIDTTLANQYHKQLQEMHIPTILYHCKDGVFSAYVDGVACQFGPSSYCDKDKMVYLGADSNISKLFMQFDGE